MTNPQSENRWKRWLAIQIASQLPEEPSEAREVLGYVHQLLDDFILETPESYDEVVGMEKPQSD